MKEAFEKSRMAELITSGELYSALGEGAAADYHKLLEGASEIEGVEVIGGSAFQPGNIYENMAQGAAVDEKEIMDPPPSKPVADGPPRL